MACMNFFSFNFPLREFFFCTSPAPRISFLMVRPLVTLTSPGIPGFTLSYKKKISYANEHTKKVEKFRCSTRNETNFEVNERT